MTVVAINEWVPDAAALGNPGALQIINAIPGRNSYQPIGSLESNTDALDGRPRGAIEALDKAKNVLQYAGDETKLYRLVGLVWTDTSETNGYATGTEEIWELERWKNKVLATNFSDEIQTIEMGGTAFAKLTTVFRCRHIGVVRDFVVAGNTWDSVDGFVRDRVRWSGFNDETDWTVSAVTLSDFRDLKIGGGIQRVVGGEFGVIVSERSTWRMTFVGAPTVFQIDEVIPGVGAISPGAVTRLGDVIYILSEFGFVALEGGSTNTPIGAGKVDKFILDDLDENHLHRISSVADPRSGRIFWAYPGTGHTNGRPNKIIIYDRALDKWGCIEQDVEHLWRSGGIGFTLEGLDAVSASVDALGVSLDSPQWKGGAPLFSGFMTDFKNGNFSGSAMTATIETKEIQLNAGRRTHLNAFRPLVDGGTVTAKVGSRDRQVDERVLGPSLALRPSGRFTTRSNARYHRFLLTISGDWTDAIGVLIDKEDARPAERRG